MRLSEKTLQKLKALRDLGFDAIEDLRDQYFINSKNKTEIENVLELLGENICDFKQLVDKFKKMGDDNHSSCLDILLGSIGLFNELIKSNRLTNADLKYLLNTADNYSEINNLCYNIELFKYILNNFILDAEIINRLNTILEDEPVLRFEYKVCSIFDFIRLYVTHYEDADDRENWIEKDENKIDRELLKLNELNRNLYKFDLSLDQKLDLAEVLKDNEIALNKLKELIDNNLESNYDFESLMNYLKKKEKKSILNI